MNRIFECWYGAQASGKTYQLRRRAAVLSQRPSIRRVVVCAPAGEWRDVARVIDPSELGAELWTPEDGRQRPPVLPSVVPGDHAGLEEIFEECTRWGDCAVILDEAALWFPASTTVENIRRKLPRTLDAILRGRHLERLDGEERPIHLVVASQYARTVHYLVSEQARTIMVAKPDGGLSAKWIREFSSPAMVRRAEELGEHQWLAIRGRDPRRG